MDERHHDEGAGGKPKPLESWRNVDGEDLLTRSEVERLTGVTKRALEHYEKEGLLCPRRTGEGVANDRRLYDVDDIERLKRIVVLRAYGLKVRQIGEVLDEGDARLIEVLEEQIVELKRQENRLRNLILFAKFVRLAGTDVFEGLAAGPEDIDAFANMVRDTRAYRDALALLQSVDDDALEAMLDELGAIVEEFVTLDEADGFRGVEQQVDRFRAWWAANVTPDGEGGYLEFWAIFEDDVLLPAVVEAVGGELASGALQMSAFYVCMKRLMLSEGVRIEAVAAALDDDVILAVSEASSLAAAVAQAMGVPDDVPDGDVAQLAVSVLSYMEGILQDEELVVYLDYRGEVTLRAETAGKARRAFELMAGNAPADTGGAPPVTERDDDGALRD